MNELSLTPEEIRAKIDKMVWSFSRVNSSSCMYSWFLSYLEGNEGEENAYAQFGIICHQTIEKFLKGELSIFDAANYFEENYPLIVTKQNKHCEIGSTRYQLALEYFQNINFDFDKYEILGVEKECLFKVGDYNFKGYIDALYRDRETGEIIIRDHKTSRFKYKVSGDISKKDLETFDHYKKQELLYAIPVIEEYGRVDYLTWNMLCDHREIKIPFNKDEFEQAQQWAINSIKTIEQEMLWLPDDSNVFFCNNLCNHRGYCPYKKTGSYS